MPTDDQKHRNGCSPVRAGRHTSHRTGVPTRQHSGVLSSAHSQSKGHPTHTSFLTSFLSLLLKITENKKLSSTKHFGNSQCESSTMLAVQTGMELQATRHMPRHPVSTLGSRARAHPAPGRPGPHAGLTCRSHSSSTWSCQRCSHCRGNTACFEGTRGPHGSTGRSGRWRPRPRLVGLDRPALRVQVPHLHRQVVPAHPVPTTWLKFTSDTEELLSEKDLLLGSSQTGKHSVSTSI